MVTRVQVVWVAVSRGLCLADMTGVLYVSFGMCDGDKSSGRLGRSQSWSSVVCRSVVGVDGDRL